MPYIGEFAALGAACCWSVAAVAHADAARMIGVWRLNLVRLPLAAFLLGLGCLMGVDGFAASWAAVAYLGLSGVVGLVVGDACLYACLTRLGPRVGIMLYSLAPAFAAGLAWFALGERLGPTAILGICLILAGAGMAALSRPENGARRASLAGIGLGLAAAFCQSAGLVVAKEALALGVDALLATYVRMLAAMAVIWGSAALSGRLFNPLAAVRGRPGLARLLLIGSVTGPSVGVWLSLVAVRDTDAGVAAALIATQPILMIPLLAVLGRERPSFRAMLAALLAVAGSALLFLRNWA